MANKKLKIMPGSVCVLDPDNILKQDQTGIAQVVVVALHKRKLIGDNIWEVRDAHEEYKGTLLVPERLLYPANTCVVRISSDTPIINDMDIFVISEAIRMIEDPSMSVIVKGFGFDAKRINRLKALQEKLEFTKKLREV